MIQKGELIYLRKMEARDAQTLLAWENDPVVWQYGDNHTPYELEDMENFIRETVENLKSDQLRYMICMNKNNRPVGCVDLFDLNPENGSAGVGILVYDRLDRRHGFGREALQLLATYAKNNLKLKKLYCSILDDNPGSIELFGKCGYTETGRRKTRLHTEFHPEYQVDMELLLS